jgi:hypothetical protein
MHKESDTKVLERDQLAATTKTKPRISVMPICIALGVTFVLVLIFGAVMIAKKHRVGKAGVMEAVYSGRSLTKEVLEPVPVKIPKFNHVVFRLGDKEIFRFTYEDGGDDLHYSFEVREGGS